MELQNALTKIDQLVKLYIQTGNRMVLSNLRAHVTTLTRKNPYASLRIEEIFGQSQLSLSIL